MFSPFFPVLQKNRDWPVWAMFFCCGKKKNKARPTLAFDFFVTCKLNEKANKKKHMMIVGRTRKKTK